MPRQQHQPRQHQRLSDTTCRSAKCPAGKRQVRIPDGDGLYLQVTEGGVKTWVVRVWFTDEGKQKEKVLTLGRYPALPLQDARDAARAAKKLQDEGIDPAQAKQQAKAAARQQAARSVTFREAATEFVAKWQNTWSESHAARQMGMLKNHLFPWLGERPIGEMEPPELLEAVERVEKNGAPEMAARVRSLAGQIFRYAVRKGWATRDIAADLKGALPPRVRGHFPAITDPVRFGELLRAIHAYKGSFVVQCALRLAPLVFQRPGQELRLATWEEIDFDTATWAIPAARMKRRKAGKEHGAPHIVPLSKQALAILRELRPVTEHTGYVFPGERKGRPISDNTLRTALINLGFGKEQAVHALRTSARTMLDERLHFPKWVIEEQLSHQRPDPLHGAYDRAQYVEQRIQMMQCWADYCYALRDGVEPKRAAEIALANTANGRH